MHLTDTQGRNQKHVAFFEPRCKGITHLDSATSILQMGGTLFPTHKLLFYTEKSHGELTRQNTTTAFDQITINPPKDIKNRQDWCKEILWDFSMMHTISRKKPEYIFCLGVTWEIVLFAKLFLRKQKILFFFHSVEQEIKRHFPFYKPDWWYWRSVEWKINNHRHIVFGENIKTAIVEIKPKARFESIDLPRLPRYDDDAPLPASPAPLSKFLVLGGGQTHGAVEQSLICLEQLLEPKNAEQSFHLYFKGFVRDGKIAGVPINVDSEIAFLSREGPLTPGELDDYINTKDFCLFLYPPETYHFTASGALLEAFAHLKPVIALHNPYFDYVFGKLGDAGYLCSTLEQIAQTIQKVVADQDTERYQLQRQNIKRGMHCFTPDCIARDIVKLL